LATHQVVDELDPAPATEQAVDRAPRAVGRE
jgi:hypothetical protein